LALFWPEKTGVAGAFQPIFLAKKFSCLIFFLDTHSSRLWIAKQRAATDTKTILIKDCFNLA
jgi:hypothetical protein